LLRLIAKGEIEEDRIRSIVIIATEEDLLHLGERNFQTDSLAPLPFRSLEGKRVFLHPEPSLPSGSFNRKPSIVVSMARFGGHQDEI